MMQIQQEKNEACEELASVRMGRVGFTTLPNNKSVVLNKKKRMARQRRSFVSSSFKNFLSSIPHVPSPDPSPQESSLFPARVIDPQKLRFLFQKELRNSDVGSLRRMVLPKRASEAHLPALEYKEGMNINMDDLDGIHVWTFKYRYWPNNNSRMYVLENTGDFVQKHSLRSGDYIMVIEGKKASDQDAFMTNHDRQIAENFTCLNELILQDYETRPCSSSFYYPPMDTTSGMSFVYETTCSNDFPMDLFGGSMTNYSRSGAFGSVENLSLDDFY
ncbi:hypothetical protein ACFE04_007128 [Oxalis oulophora]